MIIKEPNKKKIQKNSLEIHKDITIFEENRFHNQKTSKAEIEKIYIKLKDTIH